MGDALRLAGAARSEEDHGRVGQRRHRNLRLARGPLQQVFEAGARGAAAAVADHAERQPGRELARRQVLLALGMGQQDRRLGDFERMIDLRRHVTIVERRGHEPGLQAGEVVDDQGVAVGHERGDPIAFAHAELEHVGGQPVARLIQLAPGMAVLRGQQRRLIRLALQAPAQKVSDIDRLFQRRSGQQHEGSPLL